MEINKEIRNFTAMFATKWMRQNGCDKISFLQVKSKVNVPATTAQCSEV